MIRVCAITVRQLIYLVRFEQQTVKDKELHFSQKGLKRSHYIVEMPEMERVHLAQKRPDYSNYENFG